MADRSTALAKYEPGQFQMLRVAYFSVNGHRFRREAGWLCACGMPMPPGLLMRSLPPCTALPD